MDFKPRLLERNAFGELLKIPVTKTTFDFIRAEVGILIVNINR
ncbi:hypothetical protein [Okeania sp. SIO3I5]|nr:hypothetical protein [Okeania sp. SIO3I5]